MCIVLKTVYFKCFSIFLLLYDSEMWYNKGMAIAISYTLFIFEMCRVHNDLFITGIRIKNVSILAVGNVLRLVAESG